MNDIMAEGVPTSTATSRQAESAAEAVNSDGVQPVAAEPARWGFGLQHGLMLLAAGIALGVITGLWVQRIR